MRNASNQFRIYLVGVLTLLLVACTAVPVRTQIAAAADAVTSQAARTKLLLDAGVITRETAATRYSELQKAQTLVITARSALTRCDLAAQVECPAAQTAAGQLNVLLQAADAYLIEQERKK